MDNFIIVNVPQELLPQVTAEILRFTRDYNKVEVVHGEVGRVIHVDPAVADAWLEWRKAQEAIAATEVAEKTELEAVVKPEPEPPAPVAPRKRTTSTTTSPLLTDTSREESSA